MKRGTFLKQVFSTAAILMLVIGAVVGGALDEMLGRGKQLESVFFGALIFLIPASLLLAIGYIVEDLEEIKLILRDNIKSGSQRSYTAPSYSAGNRPNVSSSLSKLSSISSGGSYDAPPPKLWVCKKCGETNENKDTYCKSCGEYK